MLGSVLVFLASVILLIAGRNSLKKPYKTFLIVLAGVSVWFGGSVMDVRVFLLFPLLILGVVILFRAKKDRFYFICGVALCLLPIPLWPFIGYHAELHGGIVLIFITIPGYFVCVWLGISETIRHFRKFVKRRE